MVDDRKEASSSHLHNTRTFLRHHGTLEEKTDYSGVYFERQLLLFPLPYGLDFDKVGHLFSLPVISVLELCFKYRPQFLAERDILLLVALFNACHRLTSEMEEGYCRTNFEAR